MLIILVIPGETTTQTDTLYGMSEDPFHILLLCRKGAIRKLLVSGPFFRRGARLSLQDAVRALLTADVIIIGEDAYAGPPSHTRTT